MCEDGITTDAEDAVSARFDDVTERLARAYGRPRWLRHADPLSELMGTVLSQHTSDANTARAFASLRAAFPTWGAVREAPVEAVIGAIRCGGLAPTKAPRIQRILEAIDRQRGQLSLAGIERLGLAGARSFLLGLPGVGPKTAACVLLFSLGLPALPVDTHVHRVARRLGLIPPMMGAAAAHEALEGMIGGDRERAYAFHLNAIAHGRAICRARAPRCPSCPLQECCDYYADHRPDRAP